MTSSLIAGLFQLIVPSYAFRLVRRFGAQQVGWFIVTAFASLALLHLFGPQRTMGAAPASGITLDLVYVAGSALLLIGMGHVETLFTERQHSRSSREGIVKKWESQVKEQTAHLVKSNADLVQEIARHEAMEKALSESVAQYQLLFGENPRPMWVMDLRTCRFLEVNQAALRQYGYGEEEFMALTGRDLMLTNSAASFLQDVLKPCASAESRGVWEHCRKDGKTINVDVTALDLQYKGRAARLIIGENVTLRRREDLEARKSEKIEIIGRLAGGVSRHLNNIHTIIQTQTSALLERPQDPKSVEQLEQISTTVTRATGLTRQLLTAGGRQTVKIEPLDLNALIRNSDQMLRRLLGKGIVLENGYGSALPYVLADRHLLDHVIVTLALNARDAMADGGTLSINSSLRRVEDAKSAGARGAGEYVCLSIKDTGRGMAPEIQAQLFEPFFTTRDPGRHMGLGLATVFGAMRQQSGWVEFKSDPGVGTEFLIFLPCAPSKPDAVSTDTQFLASLTKGTVLLVEPDDRLRGLARCVLNWNGYRVIEADSAALAVTLWEGRASNVDLLLTDVNLPENVSGRVLAEQLRKSKPGLKVVYSCAYDPSIAGQNPARMEGLNFIPKPYNPDKLLQVVQGTMQHV